MTVVVPTYNESGTVARVVDRCLAATAESGFRTEVLVVDDDSPDGTAGVVCDAYSDDDRVDVVCRTGEPGLARAVTEGFRRASYEYCVVIDADLQHPPEQIPALLRALEGGAQVAVGSRYVEGGGVEDWSTYRRVVSRVGTRIAQTVVYDLDVSDPLSGFFAVERSVVEEADLDPQGYKILLEILVKAESNRVTEVPYVFSEREQGTSNLSWVEYLRFLEHVLTLRRHDIASGGSGASGGATVEEGDAAPPAVAIVTPYPPANDGVADYARKLVAGYADATGSVVVLGSGADDAEPASDDRVDVRHVWRKDDPRGLVGLACAIWAVREDRDLVHFNVKPTYFGSDNAIRFLSLCLPLFARLVPGFDVVVTMHDILEGVDPDDIGEDVGPLQRVGAAVATQLVLWAGPVTVTTPEYQDRLEERYPVGDVHHVPHGVARTDGFVRGTARTDEFARTDGVAHGVARTDGFGSVGRDPFRLLLFGYLSPYKDYETVFEAFDRLRDRHGDVELWVVGDSHPDHQAFARRIREEHGDTDGVRFFGYVEECDLPAVFADASLLVLPYRTAPGVSGPFQAAKGHGLPAVVYDDEAVLRATVGTGGDAVTVPPGDPAALAATVERLVEDPDRLRRLAAANADAENPTMTDIARRIVTVASGGHT